MSESIENQLNIEEQLKEKEIFDQVVEILDKIKIDQNIKENICKILKEKKLVQDTCPNLNVKVLKSIFENLEKIKAQKKNQAEPNPLDLDRIIKQLLPQKEIDPPCSKKLLIENKIPYFFCLPVDLQSLDIDGSIRELIEKIKNE
jgi:hypothetical protein